MAFKGEFENHDAVVSIQRVSQGYLTLLEILKQI